MSLKTAIISRAVQSITGERRLNRQRRAAERKREKEKRMHTVDVFLEAADPYSAVLAQVLPAVAERYNVRICVRIVSAPADDMAPDRERLVSYSRNDAEQLAAKAGLWFTDPGHQPPDDHLAHAEAALAALVDGGRASDGAGDILTALWQGAPRTTPAADPGRVEALRQEGDEQREALGHYLGATVHYGGEWYWGLDRLHYLEARLEELELKRDGAPDGPLFEPPEDVAAPPAAPLPAGVAVEAFLSFRSPYSYLAAQRAVDLAGRHGVSLKLRFVLPMVMRGLDVPRTKGRYILGDCAREARRMVIPFGKVADPVGKPVERGYALMPLAMEQGKDVDLAISFLKGVWSEGIDAGSEGGLRQIAERAGLDWGEAKPWLQRDDWRGVEAVNQQALLDLGIWGVPSFRVGDVATWGQDRLWVIDDALRAMADAHAASRAS